MKTRELKFVKLHGRRTLLGSIKKARNFKKPKGNNEEAQKCDRCGYNAHKPQEKCPAKNESCNKCRKIGHFAQVCRSRKSIVKVLNETLFGR